MQACTPATEIAVTPYVPITDPGLDRRIVHTTGQFRGIYHRRESLAADFFRKQGGRIFIDVARYLAWLEKGTR